MPCEACNIQFTVFKRKKSCTECRRLYCSNCLTKNKERILCKRCVIFTARPLSKIELLKLKAKDLIFYLQSKHISTTGCVEKEELVNLVLIHVGNSNNFSPDSQQQQQSPNSQQSFSMGSDHHHQSGGDDARSNPFDQIRNTCQNLFSTFTEKIASDFNFDFKPNQSDRQSNVCEDQPRYSNSFQNVPTYNNSRANLGVNGSSATTATANNGNLNRPQRPTTINPNTNTFHGTGSANNNNNNNNTQSLSSPTITTGGNSSSSASTSSLLKSTSHYSIADNPSSNDAQNPLRTISPSTTNGHHHHHHTTTSTTAYIPTASTSANNSNYKPMACAKVAQLSKKKMNKIDCCSDAAAGSGCECSDDELIAKFRETYGGDQPLSPIENKQQPSITDSNNARVSPNVENSILGPSTTTTTTMTMTKTTTSNSTTTTKTEQQNLRSPTARADEEAADALESSDISSFEDLGAVGGGVRTTATMPSSGIADDMDTDKWQIINPTTWNIQDDTASTSSMVTDHDHKMIDESINNVSYTTNLPNSITELPQAFNTNTMMMTTTTTTPTSVATAAASVQNQRQSKPTQIQIQNDDDEMVMMMMMNDAYQQVHSTTAMAMATATATATGTTTTDERTRATDDLRSKLEKTLLKSSRPNHRKITRRQSDGIVYTASTSNSNSNQFLDDLVDANGSATSSEEERSSSVSTSQQQKRSHSRKSCRKCGKTKTSDLKKYIARFRHQLETTTAFSETEIKQQLDAFLTFLEDHSSTVFDGKDDDDDEQPGGISRPNTQQSVQSPSGGVAPDETIELVDDDFDDDDDDEDDDDDDDDYDDEAGIHVYGSNIDTTTTSAHPPRQFFNLNSIEKKEDLDDLSVKQLKEVLMLNRVDFKGCCEKSELLERVQRLWDDLQNCPAVDKLPTVDLCKICMDAAIECVLLECGHMATCTSCGKVLSECPICRQYIVRVVRFFKA